MSDCLYFREKFEDFWASVTPIPMPVLPVDIKDIARMSYLAGFQFGLGCTANKTSGFTDVPSKGF